MSQSSLPIAPSHHSLVRLSTQIDKLNRRVAAKKVTSAAALRTQFCPYLGHGREDREELKRRDEALVRRLMSPSSSD